MLPGAHQGNSDESELFKSLKAHLNNRNRLQPFIGLSSIIECVNGGATQRDAFYVCEVCVCRLDMADMRNHIMGSLHRYNYTKTRHPELVSELQKGSCLSKLAWPLMDIAKKLEEKEGPGNVQVVEFDKTSYQQMESQSENAKKVIDFLKDTLKESEPEISEMITSKMWEQSPSKRIVMYSPRTKSEKPSLDLQNSPQKSNVSDSSSESFVDCSSFLSDYAGQVPLIGLVRVIECKSEDGQTYCFLCHCCRVRSLKHDIVDHLTSTSHITNYLMETHPEQLEMVDLNDMYQVELLAEKFNKNDDEAHTTKLKVVQIPESLCIQMTAKSYHWCVKTLGWNNSDFPVKYINVKRQKLSMFPHQKDCPLEVGDLKVPQDKKTAQRTKKQKNPVFKVTLPVTQGSLLVERTSFSKAHLLPLTFSPTENLCSSPPPASKFSLDPENVTCDFSSRFFDTNSEDANLTSQYQLNSSVDFCEGTHENIKQEKNEQWINSCEDQNYDSKTNIVAKAGLCADNLDGSIAHNAETPLFHSEYVPPHGFSWPVGTKDNDKCAPNPYYQQQPPQYMTPDYSPQQQVFSSGYVHGGCEVIPQLPQTGNYFSQNNSITLTDCSQSFTGFYTEHRANTQQIASYQFNSSGWGTPPPQPAPGQPPCYAPCCVPHHPSAALPNVYEPGSSNTMFYPHFYSNHRYPY